MKPAKEPSKSRLVLASRSPRRREILDILGVNYQVMNVHVDERPHRNESPTPLARRLALAKATAARRVDPKSTILAADTVVACGRASLGKPRDQRDARRMLRMLSGRWHDVVTAIAWLEQGRKPFVAHARTRVRFSELTDEEIDNYVQSDEPWDKAGGYALQGAASWFVTEIRGSVSNVIGLPIETLRSIWNRRVSSPPRLGSTRTPRPW
ncbi:MAG: Maf family protein [Acidobacteriota bacterium]